MSYLNAQRVSERRLIESSALYLRMCCVFRDLMYVSLDDVRSYHLVPYPSVVARDCMLYIGKMVSLWSDLVGVIECIVYVTKRSRVRQGVIGMS